MRPFNLILLPGGWGYKWVMTMIILNGSGIPRQPSDRARRRPLSPGHRAWRLRHGSGRDLAAERDGTFTKKNGW